MNKRIKLGDAYFDAPPDLAPRATPVVAEKQETPGMLEQGVFATAEPDAVAQYLSGVQRTLPRRVQVAGGLRNDFPARYDSHQRVSRDSWCR